MSDKIILRVFSKAGRSRVEIGLSQTVFDLKTILSERLSIPAKKINLFTDDSCKKPLSSRDTASIQSLKLKNGDILHVGNQDANMASLAESQTSSGPAVTTLSNMIDTSGKGAQESSTTTDNKPKPGASGKTSRCHHISTQKCVHCMSSAGAAEEEKKQVEEVKIPTKVRCHHGPNQKCPNCFNEHEGKIQDRKHEAFDGYIAAQRKKCAKSHASNQKC